jgi:hypothetical protein
MTTTADLLHEHLHRLAEKPSGLPLMVDLEEFRRLLLDTEERLSDISWDASAVGNAYADEVPIPFPIELEHLAVLGLVAQDVKDAIPELEKLANNITSNLYAIDRARQTQAADDDR